MLPNSLEWKYSDLKKRYRLLEEHTQRLGKTYIDLVRKVSHAQEKRDFLVGKLAETRIKKREKHSKKAPKSPFMFFCQEQKPIIRKQYAQIGASEILKILAYTWKTMAKEQRENYLEDFRRYKRNHQIMFPDDNAFDSDIPEATPAPKKRPPKKITKLTNPSVKRRKLANIKPALSPEADSLIQRTGQSSIQNLLAAMEGERHNDEDTDSDESLSDNFNALPDEERPSGIHEIEKPPGSLNVDDDGDDDMDDDDSQSSVGGSDDDDSDDHMASLPTGAFG